MISAQGVFCTCCTVMYYTIHNDIGSVCVCVVILMYTTMYMYMYIPCAGPCLHVHVHQR